MRVCTKCGAEKPETEFWKHPAAADGLSRRCKPCVHANYRAWKAANEKKMQVYMGRYNRKYYKAKKEELRAKRKPPKPLTAAQLERRREVGREWARRNRGQIIEKLRRRQIANRQQTPAWADRFLVREIYDLARLRTLATGVNWTVDHVVPIKSTRVCGLHWEGNLQVIPKAQNSSKGNRFWPDMP